MQRNLANSDVQLKEKVSLVVFSGDPCYRNNMIIARSYIAPLYVDPVSQKFCNYISVQHFAYR